MVVVTRDISKALWVHVAVLVWLPIRAHVAAAVIHVRTYLMIPRCCYDRRDWCYLQSTVATGGRTGVVTYTATCGRSSDSCTY